MSEELDGPWDMPASWCWTTAGSVADVVGGGTPRSSEPSNFGGTIPWITPADLSGYSEKYISRGARNLSNSGLANSAARLMPRGTVLFSSRAPIGYVAIAANPVTTNQGFKSFVLPADLHPDFVYYYLQRAKSLALDLASGTTFPEVSGAKIACLPFILAPGPEQHRIIDAIESYFTRLDEAVATLERVQRNLKRYRASVLKAAVEGRLVPTEAELARAEGRAYEPATALLQDAGPHPSAQKKRAGRLWGAGVVPDLNEGERATLPEGWCWAKVRELGVVPDDVVQVGPMSMRSQDFSNEGVPVLNVGCVQWGHIDEVKAHRLPEHQAEKFDRYRVQAGDVLFTRSGTVGRAAVARPQHHGWLITFHLLRARPSQERCLPEYLRIVFEGAPHVRRQTREASIGTTRAGFNTMLLAMLDIPLPPMAEQQRIVTETERILSEVQDAQGTVSRNLRRCIRLRQSILKWAFEGKLADQDPNDEPASVLLERIKAERAAAATTKPNGRGGRKKTRAA